MSSHACQSIVFRCLDFRLKPSVLSSLLAEVGCPDGSYDLVSVAGAAKDFLSNNPAEVQFLKKQLWLSQQLHGVKEVIFLMHENCGAYGIADKKVEMETFDADLKKIISALKQSAEFAGLHYKAFIIVGVESGKLSLQPFSV